METLEKGVKYVSLLLTLNKLAIVANFSILDICRGPGYTSAQSHKLQIINLQLLTILTHGSPMFHFHNPWNHQKLNVF